MPSSTGDARRAAAQPDGAVLCAAADRDRIVTGGDDGRVVATRADGTVEATRDGDEPRRFEALQPADYLFCENDTNDERLFERPNAGLVKDGINDRVVGGDLAAVGASGTKCAAWTQLDIDAGATVTLRFRFALLHTQALALK